VARYRLAMRVELPAIGTRQAWLQGTAESRSQVSPVRPMGEAITQAVRGISCRVGRLWEARAAGEQGL